VPKIVKLRLNLLKLFRENCRSFSGYGVCDREHYKPSRRFPWFLILQ